MNKSSRLSRILALVIAAISCMSLLAFAEGDSNNEYTVTLSSGLQSSWSTTVGFVSGGGKYEEDEVITVEAYSAENYEFVAWYDKNTEKKVSSNMSYKFTVKKDTSLIAIYQEKTKDRQFKLTVKANEYYLNGETVARTSNNAGSFAIGELVKVKCASNDFLYWENSYGRLVSRSAEYSFRMVSDTELTPVCLGEEASVMITFKSAFNQILSKKVYNSDTTADQIVIPDSPSKMGKDFDKWCIADADGNATTVEATQENLLAAIKSASSPEIVVVPTYKISEETYNVIRYCTCGGNPIQVETEVATDVELGAAVTIEAPEIEGYSFCYWLINNGDTPVSASSRYTVTSAVAGNTYMTAVYELAESSTFEADAYINIVQTYGRAKTGGKYSLSNTLVYYAPADYQIMGAGFVYAGVSISADNLVIGGQNVSKYPIDVRGSSGYFTMNITAPYAHNTLYTRAYLQYVDAEGIEHTAYSNKMSIVSGNTLFGNTVDLSDKTEQKTIGDKEVVVTKEDIDLKIDANVDMASPISASTTISADTKLDKTQSGDTVANVKLIVTSAVSTVTTSDNKEIAKADVSELKTDEIKKADTNTKAYDIEITGIEKGQLNIITLEKALPANQEEVEAYHGNKKMTQLATEAALKSSEVADVFWYDKDTGNVLVVMDNFSNVTFNYYSPSKTITYKDGEETLTLSPSKYTTGVGVKMLPSPATKVGQTFLGWCENSNLSDTPKTSIDENATENKTLYAKWATKEYGITWIDGDGNVIKTDLVEHGVVPEYSGDTPSKAATAQYSYTFTGWDKTPVEATGKAKYTAQFTSSVNKYTVTWKNGETTLETDESVEYGTMPTYDGTTPSKTATAQYTYTFDGWDKEVVAVTGDVTYTAKFTSTVNKYTVTWKNGDTTIETDENVEYGTMPSYDGTQPSKASTAQYKYTFDGWDKEIEEVSKDVTYTAKFTETVIDLFSVKFPNTDKYLYRVGNENEISLSSLFEQGDMPEDTEISEMHISFTKSDGSTLKDVTYNSDKNWENGTINFDGWTGVVKMSIFGNDESNKTDLWVEVIDATNATTAISATSSDVVLLNDVNDAEKITVSGNHVLYGNGFKLKYNRDGGQGQNKVSNYKNGFVELHNGTLENVQIICKLYKASYGVVPGDNSTIVGDYYQYMDPAVYATGTSEISNCYIYGARSNIYTYYSNTNLTVKNTVCEEGATANIQMWSGDDSTVTLENVTTIQYLSADGVYGFGILDGHCDSSSNTNIVINGYLKQYNWISTSDGISNTYIKNGVNSALKLTDYKTNGSVNSGIISLNNNTLSIVDNRTNSDDYLKSDISIATYSGQVYSLKSNTENVEGYSVDKPYTHTPSTNGYTKPSMKFTIDSDDEHLSTQDGVVKVQLLLSELADSLSFDFDSMFTASIRGEKISPIITCVDSEGHSVGVTDGKIEFKKAGRHYVTYSVEDSKIYDKNGNLTNETKTFKKVVAVDVNIVNGAVNNAEFEFDKTKQYFYYKTINSLGSDYKQFIPILNGLKIYDYDAGGNRTKVYDFDNENKNALASILRIDHENADQISTTTFYLDNGGVLTICYNTYPDGHGSTYTTTIKTDSSGVIYAVNDGVTATTYDATSWEVHYYEYTGNNGKTVRYKVPSSMSSLVKTTDAYKNGTIDLSTANDISNGRTNYYENDGWGRDTISILGEDGLPKNGVLFTGSGNLQLLKLATSTEASGFYCYRYGYAAQNKNVSFVEVNLNPKKVSLNLNATDAFSDKSYALTDGTLSASGTVFRSGFDFGGWYTKATGGEKVGTQSISENSWTLSNYSVAKDTTLYAHWLKSITLSFDAQGGSSVDAVNTKSSLEIKLPNAPTKDGYTFKGWYDAAGNGDGTGANLIGGAGGSYFVPENNITLYAHWEESSVKYDVTLKYNDGVTADKTIKYVSTEGPVDLPTPTYAGAGGTKAATFEAWYDGDTKITTSKYSPTSDTVLTAHWTPLKYTITLAGGNSKISGTFKYTAVDGSEETISWSNPGGGKQYTDIPYGTVSFTVNNTQKGSGDSSNYHLSAVKTSGLSTNVNWSNTASGTNTYQGTFTIDGNVTFTANRAADSSGGGTCLVAGTKITLADGSKKNIEDVVAADELLTFNHETGQYEKADPFVIVKIPDASTNRCVLRFDDGSTLGILNMHGLFDYSELQYVIIGSHNVSQYIGHDFIKYDSNTRTNKTVKLVGFESTTVVEDTYSIISYRNINVIANDLLTVSDEIEGLYNLFKYDDNLRYNSADMAMKIKLYGIADYSLWSDTFTYEQYKGFLLDYGNIAAGQGLRSNAQLKQLFRKYEVFVLK